VPLGTARTGTRADTAVFLACLVASLTALALPARLRDPLASALRRTILAPLLAAQERVQRAAEHRASMDALRAERDAFALAAHDRPELAAENARLRGLLRLGGRLESGFVAAEVLHQAGVSDGLTLLLSAGARDGVEPLAPVVAPEGLVGLVHTVDARTSAALAWTHPDFRASAAVPGTAVVGIVAARPERESGELMELRGVAYREQLAPGTAVVTSGLGGVFPRGIPIGTVQGVLSESAAWERTYLLRPTVHPARASHVLVLARARAADTLATAFDTAAAVTDTAGPARRPARRTAR
jgi:rod shape-determining protein MreC